MRSAIEMAIGQRSFIQLPAPTVCWQSADSTFVWSLGHPNASEQRPSDVIFQSDNPRVGRMYWK